MSVAVKYYTLPLSHCKKTRPDSLKRHRIHGIAKDSLRQAACRGRVRCSSLVKSQILTVACSEKGNPFTHPDSKRYFSCRDGPPQESKPAALTRMRRTHADQLWPDPEIVAGRCGNSVEVQKAAKKKKKLIAGVGGRLQSRQVVCPGRLWP